MAQSDAILTAMLDDVPDIYDKSEGSIFHDVFAPVAPEIYDLSVKINEILGKRFLDSAEGEDLDPGLQPNSAYPEKTAEYATGTGDINRLGTFRRCSRFFGWG